MQHTIDSDDVPVTGAFLSLVTALQAARKLYISESNMAEELFNEKIEDWRTRAHDLFFNTYKKHADAIGLALNEKTFEALLFLTIPPEAMNTNFEKLPETFVFNPWLGQGSGGIKRIN